VVTGASRGIGRATAEALARAGARCVLAARSGDVLEEAAATIRSRGGEARAVVCDVSQSEQVDALFRKAEELGPVAALVCAAAILEKAPFAELSDEQWRQVLAVNLHGAFLCCRRAFAAMRSGGGGRMVTLGSLSGVYATEKFPGLVAYNVSKYGVVGLTEGIAVEGRPYGISAICLSPGAVDTEMLRQANPDLRPGLGPQDVARLIVALLDDALVPASGANIPLFSNR
jgi:NAD(P)-dependent dehydrogenase (short-subunit alcohol dehydrogenase family)